jgi:hypothetical protein
MKDSKAKQFLSGGSYQWEGEYKERVMEGEYG